MKRLHIFVLLAVAVMAFPMSSAALKLKLKKDPTPMIDYGAWVASQELPESVDGVRQFYPVSVAVESDNGETDTVAVVRGFVPVNGLSARQVFLAAMVYASDHFDRETAKEGFESVDYDSNSFRALLKTTQGTNSNETTYTRSLTVSARDGGFDFEISEIDCRYREKGLIPRTQRLEKLHPDNNARHAEIVLEMANVNSAYLASLAEYAASRDDIRSPNFDKLKKGGDVCTGMTEDEVTILLGPPVNKRRSGERYRWIYANDYVIIFTDGIVTKIVE